MPIYPADHPLAGTPILRRNEPTTRLDYVSAWNVACPTIERLSYADAIDAAFPPVARPVAVQRLTRFEAIADWFGVDGDGTGRVVPIASRRWSENRRHLADVAARKQLDQVDVAQCNERAFRADSDRLKRNALTTIDRKTKIVTVVEPPEETWRQMGLRHWYAPVNADRMRRRKWGKLESARDARERISAEATDLAVAMADAFGQTDDAWFEEAIAAGAITRRRVPDADAVRELWAVETLRQTRSLAEHVARWRDGWQGRGYGAREKVGTPYVKPDAPVVTLPFVKPVYFAVIDADGKVIDHHLRAESFAVRFAVKAYASISEGMRAGVKVKGYDGRVIPIEGLAS